MFKVVPDKDVYDVIICGAGISGLYSAWRLLNSKNQSDQNEPPLKVLVLEMNSKVGGRVDTRFFSGIDDVPLELGAMRFLNSHKIVSQLVESFQLQTTDFKVTDNPFFYLRGKSLWEKDFIDPSKVPYALKADEKGKSPDELFLYAVDKLLMNTINIGLDQWVRCFREPQYDLRKTSLNFIGLKTSLKSVLSNEAFELVKDGGGYDSNFINWNTAKAIPYMLENFVSRPGAKCIVGGLSKLSELLLTEIKSLGGEVVFHQKLESFESYKDKFEKTVISCEVLDVQDNTRHNFHGQKLILALPQKALVNATYNSPLAKIPYFQSSLDSVFSQPAYKIFLAYDKPWWNHQQLGKGPSYSNLPSRMIYYFHSQKSTKAVVMVYSDMENASYWEAFKGDENKIKEKVLEHLSEIHGVSDIPAPIDFLFHHWSESQAGYHAWKANYKVPDVMNVIRNPIKTLPVYICGEAYSKAQSWMEGALCAAESILQDFFHLKALPLLPRGYSLVDENFDNDDYPLEENG